jgi:hypothetical protein
MKNFGKAFVIITLAVIIGFSMTACNDGGGGGVVPSPKHWDK